MKILVAILLVALLAFVTGLFLPWWGVAIAAFGSMILIPLRPGFAFLAGFAGVFILWAGLASWIDYLNDGVLSARISQLLPLGGSRVLLVLVTAFIGALVGGLAGTTASFLRYPQKSS